MFFNNCRLTNANLIQFENKHFKVVAKVLINGKTQKFSEIIVLLHSHWQRFFAKVSLKFSNINNRRVTSAHAAILLSFMQLIEEYLLAAKKRRLFLIPRI